MLQGNPCFLLLAELNQSLRSVPTLGSPSDPEVGSIYGLYKSKPLPHVRRSAEVAGKAEGRERGGAPPQAGGAVDISPDFFEPWRCRISSF